MFKRVAGLRAWVLGIGGFVGVISAVMTYPQLAELVLPKAYTRFIPALMIAGFAAAVWALGTADDRIDGVLYRENMAHRRRIEELEQQIRQLEDARRGRRLSPEQAATITQIVRHGLSELRKSLLAASPPWTPEEVDRKLAIRLVSLGADPEILTYRGDLAKAFEAGGFDVFLSEKTAGSAQDQEFLDAITVLRGDARNVIRPFILDALRGASLAPHEANYLPPGGMMYDHGHIDPMQSLAAVLIIGQRR